MKKTRHSEAIKLGKRIRLKREARGWTQEVLAEKSGLTDGAIKMVETGMRWPGPSTALALASALKCHIGDLYSDEMKPKTPYEIQQIPIDEDNYKVTFSQLAAIGEKLSEIPHSRRGLLLAVLFDDPTLAPLSLHDALAGLPAL